MQKSTKNKRIVFLLTNLAFQALVGQVSAYSICKAPIAQTFGYDEVFLGVLEAITGVGELIGSVSILFMSFNPVNGYLGFCILNAVGGLLLFLPRYIGVPGLRDFIMIFAIFLQFYSLSALAYTQVIFSHYYDENSQKYEHSIWYSFTFLGDFMSILIVQIVLYNLGIQWEWAKMLWAVYMLLVGVLMYCYLDDHSEGQLEIEEMLSIEDQKDNQIPEEENKIDVPKEIKKISKKQQCFMLATRVWKLLKQPNIFLVVLSFGLMEGIFVNLVYWLPFYYIEINESAYSMVSILGCSGCLFIGGIIVEYLLFQILGLERYSKNISYFLLIFSSAIYFVLWTKRVGDPKLQVILICVSNFFLACPYNRISTIDPIQQVGEEPHKVKIVFLLAHAALSIISAISSLIIGFVMKEQASYLWHVIMANVVLIVFVQTLRKILKKGASPQEKEKVLENAL